MVIKRSNAYVALFLVAITAGVISNPPGTTVVPVTGRAAPSLGDKLVNPNPAATRAKALLPADALVNANPAASRANSGADKILPPVVAELQERTFRYFWNTADPKTGLVPDRYPTPS